MGDFGLRNVGRQCLATPFCGGRLPSGWYLVIHGGHEFTIEEAARLSRGCELVACFVDERVMVSRAAGWNDGREVWSVIHEAGEDPLHLDVRGVPPAGFAAIRDRLTKQQEEDGSCDFMFDIPVSLAAELTGYRHDVGPGVALENFAKPSFFQRIFGR